MTGKTHDAMAQDVAEALYAIVATVVSRVPRDVSLTAVSTLGTLDRTGPRRITELAAAQGIAQPSMTTLVAGLERSGLVSRRPDPSDGRAALVELTPDGARYLSTRRRSGAGVVADLVAKLPPGEVAALAAAVPALHHLRALDDAERDVPARRPASTGA